jgi:Polysaccharide lyase/Bacterial Ig domain
MTRFGGSAKSRAAVTLVAVLLFAVLVAATGCGFGDSTPPRARWLTPMPSQTVRGPLSPAECELTTTDDDRVREVRFSVDGRGVGRDDSRPYTCRWDSSAAENGVHTLTAKAVDPAGNVTTVSRTFTLVSNSRGSGRPGRPAVPGLLFDADFEDGLSPPWHEMQHCPGQGHSSLERTTEHALGGRFSMKASIEGACDFGGARSGRAEVLGAGSGESLEQYTEGEQLYFGHSIYYPRDFPRSQAGFCVNMQLHTLERGQAGSSPALALNCSGDGSSRVLIRAQSHPGCDWTKPIERGVWHSFIWRVRFSARHGSWDLWYRKANQPRYRRVVKACSSNALLSPTDYAYWKLGIYRSVQNTRPLSVYHDDARVGTTFDSVKAPRPSSRH